MRPLSAQSALNKRFTYKADEEGERWSVLTKPGPIEGDCEDYSLTLIWLSERRSWLRFWLALILFRYVIWHCKSPRGRGHAIMWVRGHGWTDNIQRRFISASDRRAAGYRLIFPHTAPTVLIKFLLKYAMRVLRKLHP